MVILSMRPCAQTLWYHHYETDTAQLTPMAILAAKRGKPILIRRILKQLVNIFSATPSYFSPN